MLFYTPCASPNANTTYGVASQLSRWKKWSHSEHHISVSVLYSLEIGAVEMAISEPHKVQEMPSNACAFY